ncbi:MAG: sensor histidine kinase [Verrucomicrobiales bacterium]|jgi:signal transduction histidine kinase|nr:sensor histidine kinase [Verrucomicrobiales bacterium]
MRHRISPWLAAAILVMCPTLGHAKATDKLIVIVDDKRIDVVNDQATFYTPKYRLNVNVSTIQEPFMQSSDTLQRTRFKLQELDKDWVSNSSSVVMNLFLYFYDKSGEMVGKKYFAKYGDSPGWKGTLAQSDFTPRHEKATVPDNADSLVIVMTSAGAPHVMGTFAIADLNIYENKNPILTTSPLALKNNEPADWVRDGLRPQMSRIVQISNKDALCIEDNAPDAHSEWRLLKQSSPKVTPGKTLIIEWKEIYSIGTGYRTSKNYNNLSPGVYHLIISEQNPLDDKNETQRVITLTVITPFWQKTWFWILSTSSLLAVVIFTTRYLVKSRMRRQMQRMQQEHAMETERLRIARNIHDDLGARLTHISLMSSATENEATTLDDAKRGLQKISQMTRNLVETLYETVWTVDPKNDHLNSLIEYLSFMISELCEPTDIRCRTNIGDTIDDRPVTSEIRHGISLAVKEAAHNAIKYSQASEIRADFFFNAPTLTIIIQDNGCGFNPDTVQRGHGLDNMRQRMIAVGGQLTIESAKEQGTKIVFKINI